MDRRKKKRKLQKRERPYHRRPTSSLQPVDPKEELRLYLKESMDEDTTSLDTPFGNIFLNDGMIFQTIRDKDFFHELLNNDITILDVDKDTLTQLINFEKLNDKYPNEPYIRYNIGLCYQALKEKEKYHATVKENFEQFRGEYPIIDAEYIQLMYDLKEEDIASSAVGEELNMHKIYPKIKAFDKGTVSEFYGALVDVFRYRKDLETAKKCAEVVSSVDIKAGTIYKTVLEFDESPAKHGKYVFFTLLGLVVVLAIIIGIIWGIVKFFQWIF